MTRLNQARIARNGVSDGQRRQNESATASDGVMPQDRLASLFGLIAFPYAYHIFVSDSK
jgi:hypothetical protein